MSLVILVHVWWERTSDRQQYMHAEYCDIHVTSVIKCTIAFQLTFAHMRPAIKLHFFFDPDEVAFSYICIAYFSLC
jgi:hypothetical protein